MISLRNKIPTQKKRIDAFLVYKGKSRKRNLLLIDFPLPPFFSPVTHQGEFGSLHCYSLAFHLDFLLGRLSCFIVIIPNNTVLELCRDDR